jgi:glucose/arabinose dehydrogenase
VAVIILLVSAAFYFVALKGTENTTQTSSDGERSTVVTTTASLSTTASSSGGTSTLAPPGNMSMTLSVAFPNLSFSKMVFLTSPDDGTNRIFVVLQTGLIMVFPNEMDASSAAVFLNISRRITDAGNEQGLLGLAFDPHYSTNGYFYVYYTAAAGSRHAVVSRFSVNATNPNSADPNSELVILQIPQPPAFNNHNGGMLAFGPDGDLYIGVGDGGSEGDPLGNGQNTSTLLGKILRIDVSGASADHPYTIPSDNPFVGKSGFRGEIWAYGLRNPWRFSFDASTGQLWVGDVGQDKYEEVDLITKGGNYGWNTMEGFSCYSPASGCNTTGLQLPVLAYPHTMGCAVMGGYVYTGPSTPSLQGVYVYGDYCSGNIWGLEYNGTSVTYHAELVAGGPSILSFGVDASGNLYVLSSDGNIYELGSTS